MSRPHVFAVTVLRAAVLLGFLLPAVSKAAAAEECGAPRVSLATITPWPARDAHTLPVSVTWTGAEPGSRYELQASWNGSSFTTVSAEPISSGSLALAVPLPGAGRACTVQFRVRPVGRDGARWTAGEPMALTSMDESALVLRYEGRWQTVRGATALGGSRAETRGGRVRFVTIDPFGATGALAWFATMGPDRGIAQVRVDDGPAVDVDLYAPVRRGSLLAFASAPLESGALHSLEISVRGRRNPAATDSRVDVDGVVVLDHEPQPERPSLGPALLGMLDAATGGNLVRTQGADNPLYEIHDDYESLDGPHAEPDPAASVRRAKLEAGAIWASPNPSRAPSQLLFQTRANEKIRLTVVDAQGRAVRALVEGTFSEGVHSVVWDGTDMRGARAPAGVYLIVLHGTARTTMTQLVRMP